MRHDIDEQKEQIVSWLEEGIPRFEVSRRLNCKYDTLKSRLDKWNITINNQPRRGIPHPEVRKDASYYFNNKVGIHSAKLREKLFQGGYKERVCEECKNTIWNNKPIPLELDHINGDHYDNRLKNLRILCPNCHAQTETYSGKNKGTKI